MSLEKVAWRSLASWFCGHSMPSLFWLQTSPVISWQKMVSSMTPPSMTFVYYCFLQAIVRGVSFCIGIRRRRVLYIYIYIVFRYVRKDVMTGLVTPPPSSTPTPEGPEPPFLCQIKRHLRIIWKDRIWIGEFPSGAL